MPPWLIDILPNIISGVFGFGSQMATNSANARGQDSANQANKELMQMQNQFNVQQWQRQQEYNLPVNQMKRLQDAGINPALAYTNGVQGNTASTAPSASSTPTMLSSTFSNPFTELMDSILKQQQLKNAKAEENLTKANTEATYKNIEVSKHVIVQIDESVKLSQSQRDYLGQQGELIRKNIESIDVDNALKNGQITYQKLQNEIAAMCKDADVRKRMAEAKISEQQFVNMVAQLYNIHADTIYKKAQTANVKMDTHVKSQQYRLLGISYQRGKIEFDLWKDTKGPDSTYGRWTSSSFWQGTTAILELLGDATGVVGNLLSGVKPKPNYNNTTIKID